MQIRRANGDNIATDFRRGVYMDEGTTLTEIMRFNEWFEARCVEIN